MARLVNMHDDLEYAVEDGSKTERIFKDPNEAAAFAFSMALARGESHVDVLVWSEAGAKAYGGDDALDRYREDPEASVFERLELKVNNLGRIP